MQHEARDMDFFIVRRCGAGEPFGANRHLTGSAEEPTEPKGEDVTKGLRIGRAVEFEDEGVKLIPVVMARMSHANSAGAIFLHGRAGEQ